MLHVPEDASPLAVEQLSVLVQNSQCRNPNLWINSILRCHVQIFILEADVDVYHHKVFRHNRVIRSLVEVNIQNYAVAAPVPAKVQNHPLMLPRRRANRLRDIRMCVGRSRVNGPHLRRCKHPGSKKEKGSNNSADSTRHSKIPPGLNSRMPHQARVRHSERPRGYITKLSSRPESLP